ncbi:hypothetical protein TNCV_4663461 [Trichonephila clavipes]|uniref:Uncharacterized protein n=1 Tax=Trichonephila clavipes TaxID=2585209 RepID=A0A8X6VKC2_TRICX|nr:hypothetical protein TNCV_4663461 [Trichonephila clavipes]
MDAYEFGGNLDYRWDCPIQWSPCDGMCRILLVRYGAHDLKIRIETTRTCDSHVRILPDRLQTFMTFTLSDRFQ